MIKNKETGLLLVVSGPSGCGKSTVNNIIVKQRNDTIMSISDTTRNMRKGEKNGEDYNFISINKFENKIRNNEYLEYAKVHYDKYYGTPLKKVKELLNNGYNVILEIDIQGAYQINEKIKDAVFIFIMPPSMKDLKERLILRNTESKDQIIERFKTAYKEINEVSKYNYVIVNTNINNTVNKINSIIESEKCRVDRIEDIYLGNQEEIIHEILTDNRI